MYLDFDVFEEVGIGEVSDVMGDFEVVFGICFMSVYNVFWNLFFVEVCDFFY